MKRVPYKISKDELFERFGAYCREKGLASISKAQVGADLPRYIGAKAGKGSKGSREWKGIKFKKNSEGNKWW